MLRFGFLGLLLLFLVVPFASAQSPDVTCTAEWHVGEVDSCLESITAPPAPGENTASSFSAKVDGLPAKPEADNVALTGPVLPVRERKGFQWGAALSQSARLLAFQQGMMLATDKWARYSLTHYKFFSQYVKAVKGTVTQWDDGDPFLDNYIGHPLQGAVAGYIQVQNDPQGRDAVFGKGRAYWKSRAKAMGWIALYSTQFEIGPISEASIEKLGSFEYRNCPDCKLTRGAGWVDLVVTPTLGTAWMIGEDALDRFLVRRAEGRFGRGKWSNFFRCALNPARMGANLLRLKAPWYRDRDAEGQLIAVAQ